MHLKIEKMCLKTCMELRVLCQGLVLRPTLCKFIVEGLLGQNRLLAGPGPQTPPLQLLLLLLLSLSSI